MLISRRGEDLQHPATSHRPSELYHCALQELLKYLKANPTTRELADLVFLDPCHHYPSTWLGMARKQKWNADPYATGSLATNRHVHWTGCSQRNCALDWQQSRLPAKTYTLIRKNRSRQCKFPPPPPPQKTTWDGRCYPGRHTALTSPYRRSTFLLREWKAMTTWTTSKVTSRTLLTFSHQPEFFCASVGRQWLKLVVKLISWLNIQALWYARTIRPFINEHIWSIKEFRKLSFNQIQHILL